LTGKGDKVIFTLGTSVRSPQEFLDLLQSHGVSQVVDVRSFPTSRFEHFRQDRLTGFLAHANLRYVYLGKELGGYRSGGYEAFTETDQFKRGVDQLEQLGSHSSTAIVCAERFPWRCHRRFIASDLEARGWQVRHIIDRSRDWIPSQRSRAARQRAQQ
jgi:uncharacterized protein (DUF488 family)